MNTARLVGPATVTGDEAILGKTGTCTDTAQPGVHLGWFGSFNDFGDKKLVVVVLLTGGRGVSGPIASGVAGNVYHNLALQNYFGPVLPATASIPTALVSMQSLSHQIARRSCELSALDAFDHSDNLLWNA